MNHNITCRVVNGIIKKYSRAILLSIFHGRASQKQSYLQVVLKMAQGARWVSGVQVFQVVSEWLLLFPQQTVSWHLISPGWSLWEAKTWWRIIKTQQVKWWLHNSLLIWVCCTERSSQKNKNNQTFLWRVDFIDADFELFFRHWFQHRFHGQLLPPFHLLFTLFLKVKPIPFIRKLGKKS